MKHSRQRAGAMRNFAKALAFVTAAMLAGYFPPSAAAADATEQVVFVCQHGNVKSLMAASYFNQLAAERNLPLRAVSRGVAVDSTSAPPAIVTGLRSEGIDVVGFHPVTLGAADAAQARRVIAIGTDLPQPMQSSANIERWNDVPAASTNYSAARDSLRAHVKDLIERLSRPATD